VTPGEMRKVTALAKELWPDEDPAGLNCPDDACWHCEAKRDEWSQHLWELYHALIAAEFSI
jgi:hypothetical protein